MKNWKWILGIVAAVLAVAAAVTAVIVFRNEIVDFCATIKTKIHEKKNCVFAKKEFEDYADI